MADIAKSVLARLQNKAKETGRSFQLCLQLFCQEEFLRRVASSSYSENLVLKGGLFIYTLTGFESRATVDIDFLLRSFPNSPERIESMVREITLSSPGNDFITFEVKSSKQIALHQKYNGVSVSLIAAIKNTKTPFHIDFGIGDVIIPRQEKRAIPTQLENFEQPIINTYSLESTIAEKFDAIISRLEFTSRMKDYYDIYYLANKFQFDARKLQEAVYQTLQNRGTTYDRDTLNIVLNFATDSDMIKKWKAFIKRIQVLEVDFSEVLRVIGLFLSDIFDAIINEDESWGIWNPQIEKYQRGF